MALQDRQLVAIDMLLREIDSLDGKLTQPELVEAFGELKKGSKKLRRAYSKLNNRALKDEQSKVAKCVHRYVDDGPRYHGHDTYKCTKCGHSYVD